MGTWGPHIFDNDVAADWLANLPAGDHRAVEATLDALLNDTSDGLFDADLAARAIAAAQVVAQEVDKGGTAFQQLVTKAQMALVAAAGGASELAQQWQEAGAEAHEEWTETLRTLNAQLTGEAPAPVVVAVMDVPQDRMLEAIETRLRGLEADVQMVRTEIVDEIRKLRRTIGERRA